MSKKVKRTPLSPAARAYLKAKREVWERTLEAQIAFQTLDRGWPWGLGTAQFRFAPPRRWAFDRAWPDLKVAIEVQGGIWRSKGAHNTGPAIKRDCEKGAEALVLGWLVLHVTPDQVKSGQAIKWLSQLVFSRLVTPSRDLDLNERTIHGPGTGKYLQPPARWRNRTAG